MQLNSEKALRSGITTIIVAIVIISGILLYNAYIMNRVSVSTETTLNEILTQQAYNFTSKIEGELSTLQMLACNIAHTNDVDEIGIDTLKSIAEKSSFAYMTIVNTQGQGYYSGGEIRDISDQDYFHQALAGETVLSEPVVSKVRDAKIVVLATPILFEGEIIGVLSGSYLVDQLNSLFLPSFEGKGYAYITTNEGKIIAKTLNEYTLLNSDNAFDIFEHAHFYDGDDYETIKRKVAQNQSGQAKYNYNGQKRIMHYMTIGVNNWNIFSIVPEEVVARNAKAITISTTVLSFAFITVFIILMLRGYWLQKKNVKRLEEIAFVDTLTKSATLPKFRLDAQELISEGKGKKFIIIKLDVDNFKMINQMYGYAVGDRLLIAIAKAIKSRLPDNDGIFARLNTDEFIILHEYHSNTQLQQNRAGLLSVIHNIMGESFKYSLYIPTGRYIFTPEEVESNIILAIERVNFAHRQAKQTRIQLYDYDDTVAKNALKNKEIENKMEAALAHRAFKVFLQPKYYLSNETIAGAEALVRWKDGEDEVVYPGQFIPLFEQNGFITRLDMFMFDKVCSIIKGWIESGITPVVVSVNFSRNHLTNPEFVETLCHIADKHGTPRHYLEIELTESTMFHNEDVLIDVLDKLHNEGFTLSMDDFGTGYSSLGLLKNLPVDVIKIDRSFFSTAKDVSRAKTVIMNVMKMAAELGIHTVAEGVETKEHIDLLRELGCDIVQGYYYAKPMPEEEFTATVGQMTQFSVCPFPRKEIVNKNAESPWNI